MSKHYNKLYMFRRLVMQITTHDFSQGFIVDLLPSFGFAVDGRYLHIGFSLEWMFGTINVGWARRSFVDSERQRHDRLQQEADKLGITKRQQELRWGW